MTHHAPAFARRHHLREGMNATERAYADILDVRMAAGEVRWWRFEGIKLLVAGGNGVEKSYYQPDFIVQMADDSIELHEVKGYMTEAARLRTLAAASLYPFVFRVARHTKLGWDITELGGSNAKT